MPQAKQLSLQQRIINQSQNEYKATYEEHRERAFERNFGRQAEVEVMYIEISLLCAYSQRRLNIPVRSRLCTHNECIDLDSWCSLYPHQRSMRDPIAPCPICGKKVNLSTLEIDKWMERLVETIDPGVKSITMDKVSDLDFRNWKMGAHARAKRNREMNAVVIEATQDGPTPIRVKEEPHHPVDDDVVELGTARESAMFIDDSTDDEQEDQQGSGPPRPPPPPPHQATNMGGNAIAVANAFGNMNAAVDSKEGILAGVFGAGASNEVIVPQTADQQPPLASEHSGTSEVVPASATVETTNNTNLGSSNTPVPAALEPTPPTFDAAQSLQTGLTQFNAEGFVVGTTQAVQNEENTSVTTKLFHQLGHLPNWVKTCTQCDTMTQEYINFSAGPPPCCTGCGVQLTPDKLIFAHWFAKSETTDAEPVGELGMEFHPDGTILFKGEKCDRFGDLLWKMKMTRTWIGHMWYGDLQGLNLTQYEIQYLETVAQEAVDGRNPMTIKPQPSMFWMNSSNKVGSSSHTTVGFGQTQVWGGGSSSQ